MRLFCIKTCSCVCTQNIGQISALSTDLLSIEMFVSFSFTPYLLLILCSIISTTLKQEQLLKPTDLCQDLNCWQSWRAPRLVACLNRQLIPCCFLFVFPCWLQLHLPSDALSWLQGKTSNIMFSLCGQKCPWEIGCYQNIFDRNFVPINAKCFSWHMSCHLLQWLLVNDHKWLSTVLETDSSVSLLGKCVAERLGSSSAVTFRMGNQS